MVAACHDRRQDTDQGSAEVKYLASERAALVYDNYSKLIAATDTIKRMRTNMAPLTPATSTLVPAVAHIAETAKQLALKAQESPVQSHSDEAANSDRQSLRPTADKATVRWGLDTPRRITELGPAAAEWELVRKLLRSWQGVEGVDRVQEECERALQGTRS